MGDVSYRGLDYPNHLMVHNAFRILTFLWKLADFEDPLKH